MAWRLSAASAFTAGCAVSALGTGAVYPVNVIYLHLVRGLPVRFVGLSIFVSALAAIGSAPVAGHFLARLGGRTVVVGALLIQATGTAAMIRSAVLSSRRCRLESDLRERLIMHILLVNQGDRASKRFIPWRLSAAGHRLDLLHWSPAVWDREHFGQVMAVRFADWAGLAAAAGRAHDADPFDGVLCYDEATVPIANDLARLLRLPAVSTHWGDAFRYKDRMRVAWEAAGLRVPRYRVLHRKTDLRPLATWRFPVVLKPTAMMGSRGVVKAESFADLARCWHLPFDADEDMRIGDELWSMAELFDIPQAALAEEYIAGPEFSAEGVVVDGTYHLVGITGKSSGGAPYFDEIGHVFPADNLPVPAEPVIGAVLEAAHRALGLCNGVTHTEFRVDDEGVCLMELNARIPGGHITELVELVTGIDLVEAAARVACGALPAGELTSPPAGGTSACAAAVHLTAPRRCLGTRFRTAVVPDPRPARLLATHLHVGAGDPIQAPRLSGETRLGSVILAADDPAALARGIARVRADSEIICG